MNPGPLPVERRRRKPYGPETCPKRRAIVEMTVARALADLGPSAASAARHLAALWLRGPRQNSVDNPLAVYLFRMIVGLGLRVVYVVATPLEIRILLAAPSEIFVFGPPDAAKWFLTLYDSGMLANELAAPLRPEEERKPN